MVVSTHKIKPIETSPESLPSQKPEIKDPTTWGHMGHHQDTYVPRTPANAHLFYLDRYTGRYEMAYQHTLFVKELIRAHLEQQGDINPKTGEPIDERLMEVTLKKTGDTLDDLALRSLEQVVIKDGDEVKTIDVAEFERQVGYGPPEHIEYPIDEFYNVGITPSPQLTFDIE